MPLPDTTVSCKSPGTRQRTTNTGYKQTTSIQPWCALACYCQQQKLMTGFTSY